MKYILLILFIFYGFLSFTQQFIEICEGYTPTYTYFSTTNDPGNNEWTVNGQYFYTEELEITWDTPGNYQINVIRYSNGCPSLEMTYNVTVTQCPELIYWVPNCFTPDGNEFNQLYGPVMNEGYDINGFEFVIFNRWGEIVWKSNNPNSLWDGLYNGKMCTDGVYIWKLTFNIFGNDGKITDHGHLTLIR